MPERGFDPNRTIIGEWRPTPEDLARLPEELRKNFERTALEVPRPAGERRREKRAEAEAAAEAPPALESFVADEAANYLESARTTESLLLADQEAVQRKAFSDTIMPIGEESYTDALVRHIQQLEQSQIALRDSILADRMRADSLLEGIEAIGRGEPPPADFKATLDLIEREAVTAVGSRSAELEKNPNALGYKEELKKAQKRLKTIADLRRKAGV
ncbi:hypothetical protein EPN90_04330 [Patescibacteria group bacterium]|nr:MAG: hypothetical protein EPN90_04330 [Patescibacteria group bacterium]